MTSPARVTEANRLQGGRVLDLDAFARRQAQYYAPFLKEFGPTARGADWKSEAAQELRFQQLMKVVDGPGAFSLNDYGCGYGGLIAYLRKRGFDFSYTGFDLVPQMLKHAGRLFGDSPGVRFAAKELELMPATYTVANGLLNLKLDIDDESWTSYAIETIHSINRLSERGFAFNILTKYSDPEQMRDDLYYADPGFFFDYCKRNFSRHVALLHDYGAWEFTVIVRRAPLTR